MFTPTNKKELEENGFTVVQNVISQEDCDRHQTHFRQWLANFPEGEFPRCRDSLIQKYSSGHTQPAWETRLAAKTIYSQVWGTDRLLSSMDAIAIGRPPEEGQEMFWAPDQSWLHVDQSPDRKGLHGYQGAVYLETCDEDDWTFEIIKGSHKYFDEIMKKTETWRFRTIKDEDIQWLELKDGCKRMRVPCPKGGMILWDTRLFHANARPLEGRTNSGRWRFVVFVCMAPAWWATSSDLAKKKEAYEKLLLTTHWPCQDVDTFEPDVVEDPNQLKELPAIARSEEAQQLAGVLPYSCRDGDNDDEERRLPKPMFSSNKEICVIA